MAPAILYEFQPAPLRVFEKESPSVRSSGEGALHTNEKKAMIIREKI
jgi:hypothetical protein